MTCAQSSQSRDRMTVILTAMLAVNLGVTLINTWEPPSAAAQVQSYQRSGENAPVYVNASGPSASAGNQSGSGGPNSAQALARIADQMTEMNQRLARVESQLQGPLSVNVINMPSK